MRKRLLYGSGTILLFILLALVVWQGSFNEVIGQYGPANPGQTYTLWAVSTLIFLLTITLGFMLARAFVRLYVERHSNREGSRIRTKLVLGALALTCVPVFFLVSFSISVLNRTLERWFTQPAEKIKFSLIDVSTAMDRDHRLRAQAQADWLSMQSEIQQLLADDFPRPSTSRIRQYCRERDIYSLDLNRNDGRLVSLCSTQAPPKTRLVRVRSIVPSQGGLPGELVLFSPLPVDLEATKAEIDREVHNYEQLKADRNSTRWSYIQLIVLIALFILFVAIWLALFLAKQISVPISALLGAAHQVRQGNLSYRVQVGANDELASLVRAFNEMTQGLETSRKEIEDRRRFTEAILESIPSGVISLSADGRILLVNRALMTIFPEEKVRRAARLDQLFSRDDTAELRYLMKRARRLGLAGSQFEIKTPQKVYHLSVTVAALEDKITSGFVLVLEDTSEVLRAQKAAAWHEVARKIAHEIKNPLTPISLCAERIARQLERAPVSNADTQRILNECAVMIGAEVESLRALVDEFAQFARFPAAQPVPSDLNEIVENALAVFHDRLEGITLVRDLAASLPPVNIDREQFKRLVVNLVDNAAEAMQNALVKKLWVRTLSPAPGLVELTVSDTGCGISTEDKEKLFLPYFSTKNRGTGLGLAIVNQILSDHNAHIRVEDNSPTGASFTIELAALAPLEPEEKITAETPA